MANTVVETLPRERTANAPTVASVAAFSMPGDVPEKMHPVTREALRKIAGALRRAEPAGVEAVVAYTPVSWERQPSEVKLITIERAGLDRWETLTPMAEAIGPLMGELPFTPIQEPASNEDWRWCVREKKGWGWRHVSGRGVLLYSAETEEQPV